MRSLTWILTLLGVALVALPARAAVERFVAEVVRSYPHDPGAFTQGLLLHEGALYETTGQYGSSSLRQVNPTTGVVERQVSLGSQYFGEGLALLPTGSGGAPELVVLTWHENTALGYSLSGFSTTRTWSYPGEGWGLCFDGTHLVMSNGTSTLVFRDSTTFAEARRVTVTLEGAPVSRLNELECTPQGVWANVWQRSDVVRIDPSSGAVTAVLDASSLRGIAGAQNADVLNGIAYDPLTGHLLMTGKYWPRLLEVKLSPAAPASSSSCSAVDPTFLILLLLPLALRLRRNTG